MALNPENTKALTDAIDAIVQSCGKDPKYAQLIDKLKSVQEDVRGDADNDVGLRDGANDNYSFETAQKRHVAARKQAAPPQAAPSAPAATSGGDSKPAFGSPEFRAMYDKKGGTK